MPQESPPFGLWGPKNRKCQQAVPGPVLEGIMAKRFLKRPHEPQDLFYELEYALRAVFPR
jgi:hypothetical protein